MASTVNQPILLAKWVDCQCCSWDHLTALLALTGGHLSGMHYRLVSTELTKVLSVYLLMSVVVKVFTVGQENTRFARINRINRTLPFIRSKTKRPNP